MNGFFVFIYFVLFAVLAGAAFAMMWSNIMSINNDMKEGTTYGGARPRKHPEAPALGEEVMYVDLTKERLEALYKEDDENK